MDEHAESRVRSARGRPFPPGVSGNPGGRPKGLAARVREETREGEELVEFMVGVLRDPSAALRLRIDSARWLADRGFGRVPELVIGDTTSGETDRGIDLEADLAELEAIEAEMKRRRAA